MDLKNYELYFCVDKDDVLVKSSPLIESQVNSKTNFKTATLEMLEQLNRNCTYYYNKVKEECGRAKEEYRFPNLSMFPNFEKYDWSKDNDIYTGPVLFAKYYVEVAKKLLNQFLEERDTFLETDNLRYGMIRNYNYRKEMHVIEYYVDLIANNREDLKRINEYCLEEIKDIVKDAKRKNINGEFAIPEYGDLVKADTNDIIKTTSLTINSSAAVTPYKKPIEDVKRCLDEMDRMNDIIRNATVFITPSKELIDYESIYQSRNVNWNAVRVVKKVMKSGLVGHTIEATHHNGEREVIAKIRLNKETLPGTEFIGQRFHPSEHDAERRFRSSKIDEIVRRKKIMPEQVALMDDSKDNCRDCKEKGGNEIHYKPYTDAEILKRNMEKDKNDSLRRITEFNEDEVIEIIRGCKERLDKKVKKLTMGAK